MLIDNYSLPPKVGGWAPSTGDPSSCPLHGRGVGGWAPSTGAPSSCPPLQRGVGGWAPCTLVLGGFDGLHRGHRQLFAAAKNEGLPVAMTTMFGKGDVLFTRGERRFLFEQAGVNYLLELDLTDEVLSLPAEEFLTSLFAFVPARAVHCGEDFRFGNAARGTPELLKNMAPCPVTVHETIFSGGERGEKQKFSTSACKKYLKEGDFLRLNACLTADDFYDGYFVQGEVEHGRQVGRTYGFPTLNLSVPEEKLLPPDGVYMGLCATPKGNFSTIINIGARPTFGVEERKIEAYLDGFSGDLYGATVRIYPTQFLRHIQKFSSAEALKEQLQRDISAVHAPALGRG